MIPLVNYNILLHKDFIGIKKQEPKKIYKIWKFLYLQEIIISYCRKLMTKKLVISKKINDWCLN